MKLLDFIYNDTTISFEQIGNDDVMVNATEMAKAFPNKRINDFVSNQQTSDFIKVFLEINNGNSRFIEDSKSENSRFFGIETEADLIISKQKSGTWMHRILALKFAAWLDPQFEVWVWKTIDTIILGHYKDQRDATIEKIKAEKAAAFKREELLEKYPDFAEFLQLVGKVDEADKKRIAAIKASTNQLKLEFFTDSQ